MARKWLRRNITHKNVRNYAKTTGMVAGVAGTAALALKTALQVKAMLNVEHKYIDTQFTANINSAGIQALTNCAQGDQPTDRNGNQIKIINNLCKITAVNAAALTTPSCLRIGIVLDTSPNGVSPTFTDIFEVSTIESPRNMEAGGRFRVLWDRVLCFNPASGTIEYHLDIYKKIIAKAEYYNNTSLVTAMSRNHLYFYYISNVGANGPSLTFYNRTKFIDN